MSDPAHPEGRDPEDRTGESGRPAPDSGGIRCPFCHSDETEEMAVFGSRLSTAHYYCRACHTPFEYIHRAPVKG